jgi:hypothetical protein
MTGGVSVTQVEAEEIGVRSGRDAIGGPKTDPCTQTKREGTVFVRPSNL